MRVRHLRRDRRPDQAAVDAGAVQPARQQTAAGQVRNRRRQQRRDELRRFPQAARRGDQAIRDDQGQRRSLEILRPAHLVHGGRLQGSGDLHQTQVGARGRRQGARHAGKLPVLYRGIAKFLRRDRQAVGRRGTHQGSRRALAQSDHREAVRSRFGIGQRAQSRNRRLHPREPDLPHRSLSRQGNRPEHHGVSLRQRLLRTAVEQQLHRPRANHRRGNRRRRASRHVLRGDRRTARHGAESHHGAGLAGRDGAAEFVRVRAGARREDQGAARNPSAQARRRSPLGGARPVWTRHASKASRCRAIARSRR